MKALSITFGVSVLACGNQPCGTSNVYSSGPSLFSSNKPWQASTPSNWQNSPSSVWTQSTQSTQTTQNTPAPTSSTPRPNPSLAGRSPSEQLQLTKCRSAQSCEKCRQLNCYWDSSAKITNRCIALGLESAQVPVEAGEASNLGYCPTSGQQGYLGVNWLAIENSGAAVPNLDGMSDANVQKWLSSIPNYNPDATDSNYPAGAAFKALLPTAAKAYAAGTIPSTTPWVSFFDSYLGGGYNYDNDSNGGYNSLSDGSNSGYINANGYNYDNSYNYDASSNSFGGSLNSNGFNGFASSSNNFGMFGSNSNGFGSSSTNFGGNLDMGSIGSSYSYGGGFPTSGFSGSLPSVPSAPLCCGGSFGGISSTSSLGFPSISSGFNSIPQPASSLPMFPMYAAGSPLPTTPLGGQPWPSIPIAAPLPAPFPSFGGSSLPIPAQPFGAAPAPACCG